LADYADQTGTDLSQNPFAEKIQHFTTPDAILELLQEREMSFKEYRNANRGLIDCLSPAVRVLHALSSTLGEAFSLVSHTCLIASCVSPVLIQSHQVPFPPAKAIFVGIDVLLAVRPFNPDLNQISSNARLFQAASGVSSSYDALLDLFECLTSFLKRLEIYTNIPPTPIMTNIIIKIIVELLSVLSLATKQIRQGRFSMLFVMHKLSVV
jgi:hypothetical protein